LTERDAAGGASYHHSPQLVDSLRLAAGLALLLVGGRRHRPLLAARHGIRGLPQPAILAGGSRAPGATLQGGGPSAPVSRLRQGPAVRRQAIPVHLVQQPSAPHATPRIDPRRGPLPSATSDPFPAPRAPTAMAASFPVRVTSYADSGSAGSPVQRLCPLARRAPPSADRHAQPRGIEPPAVRRDGDRCGVRLSFNPTRRVELATRVALLALWNRIPRASRWRPPYRVSRIRPKRGLYLRWTITAAGASL
jgi:hypothetical protein